MKKKLIILGILLILLVPIKFVYSDGGSKEYAALLYKITCFHRIDTSYESGYKEGCELHLIPDNFKTIDYYDSLDPRPKGFNVSSKANSVNATIGSYNWCNKNGKCGSREILLSNDFNAYKYVIAEMDENIEFVTEYDMVSLKIYKDSFDNGLDIDLEYDLKHLKCELDSGRYVVEINSKDKENTVTYYFGLKVK